MTRTAQQSQATGRSPPAVPIGGPRSVQNASCFSAGGETCTPSFPCSTNSSIAAASCGSTTRCLSLAKEKRDSGLHGGSGDYDRGWLQVPWEKRQQLLLKGGLDPKKDLLNLTLRYDVRSISMPGTRFLEEGIGVWLSSYEIRRVCGRSRRCKGTPWTARRSCSCGRRVSLRY